MKPLTWPEFGKIFLAALVAAIVIDVLWVHSRTMIAHARVHQPPIVPSQNTQIGP